MEGKKSPVAQLIDNPNERVPCWDQIIQIIKENAPKLQHFDVIGWDFTVTEEGHPICIEYNIQRPGTILYQNIHGPFFEEHTDEVLAFLKDKKIQNKYVPKWMRT